MINHKIIPWILVVWFFVPLTIHVLVVPGVLSKSLVKLIPFLGELHIILLSFLYKPYIF